MASSIGVGAFEKTPKNAFIKFPDNPLKSSTSGIGSGASSQSFGRYSAEPTHHFQYKPGSRTFWKTYRSKYIAAKGTWGAVSMQKFNPVKQVGGSSGYLNQKPVIKRSADFRTMVNYGRNATDHFVPRGGNTLRVVGTELGEETDPPPPYDFQNFGGKTGPPGNDLKPYRGADMERRNVQAKQIGEKNDGKNDNIISSNGGGDGVMDPEHLPSYEELDSVEPTEMRKFFNDL